MRIGIVGIGVVGGAIRYGLEKLGHSVAFHDTSYETEITDIIDTDICFICVPTPVNDDGSCDTSIVESVVCELIDYEYKGTIAIKSTVGPGTTLHLKEKYKIDKICFVPEFLRERCAVTDFTENHEICIIGTSDKDIYNNIVECHGKYPNRFIQVSETEAELCKYFHNIYNATLITFANSFYEVCKAMDVDYTKIKNAVATQSHISDMYLDCNDSFRGFGGVCLPKDTQAIDSLCKELGIDVKFFETIINENNKYKVTVFDGMRK